MSATASRCRSCRQPVVWVHTQAGKTMPLDPHPSAEGNVTYTGRSTVNGAGVERPEVRVAAQPALLSDEGPHYVSHFTTCPQSEQWRRS